MKLARSKFYVFIVVGVIYFIGQYLRGFWFPLITWPFHCYLIHSGTTIYCDPISLDTGFTLISLGQWSLLVAAVLLFANERGFKRWLKFSYFYIPILLIIVFAVFPVAMPVGTSLSSESAVRNFTILYAIITAGIVLYSWLRRTKAKS